jgi:tRNA (guanine37-N1)-methyltransferase
MKIEVVTLFPRMIAGTLEFGVVGRAIARGLLSVGTEDPRSHTARCRRSSSRSYRGCC